MSLSSRRAPAIAPRIREIPPGESLKSFIDLTWSINRDDPYWISPLRQSVEVALDRKKHPFHRHASVAYFLAERNGRPVGRIAAILNRRHNEFHGDRVGFFGLFECEPDISTASRLLDAAAEWLRERGCDSIRGPMNFSTNEEVASPGVLIEGFDTRPTLMMGHNPPYYGELIEQAGFVRCKDLFAIHLPEGNPMPDWEDRETAILDRYNAIIRPLDLRRFKQEVETIKEVYNAAWAKNWGFVPVTDEEFDFIAHEFRPIVDPDLCLIAEVGGKPVGFSLALPDLNQALRHLPDGRLFPFGLVKLLWHRRKVDAVRIITFGFKPPYQQSGLGVGFYMRTWRTGIAKGYFSGEASWILEDNYRMVRPVERLGGRIHRRYRIYERAI